MSKDYTFVSELGAHISDFIAQKRSSGFLYDYEASVLKTFDNFWVNHKFCGIDRLDPFPKPA